MPPAYEQHPEDNLGVYDVDWEQYTHAYGLSTDVPQQLLALQSNDAETREQAIEELSYNIYHQGSVYEASQYAVPFLIIIATNQKLICREAVIRLLSWLANGSSWHKSHRPFLEQLNKVPDNSEAVIEE